MSEQYTAIDIGESRTKASQGDDTGAERLKLETGQTVRIIIGGRLTQP